MKRLVFLVLVSTLAACSGSPPMSPADQLMGFAFAEEVEDLMYTAGVEIYPVVLPEAVGGR